jgi:hypothetical protein
MSKITRWAALLITTGVFTGSAQGQSLESIEDVRCFIVALYMSQAADPAVRAAAPSVWMYYLGRLNGRQPTLDLQRVILSELQVLKPNDLQSESRRCGKAVVAQGQLITTIGNELQRRSSHQSSQADPSLKN